MSLQNNKVVAVSLSLIRILCAWKVKRNNVFIKGDEDWFLLLLCFCFMLRARFWVCSLLYSNFVSTMNWSVKGFHNACCVGTTDCSAPCYVLQINISPLRKILSDLLTELRILCKLRHIKLYCRRWANGLESWTILLYLFYKPSSVIRKINKKTSPEDTYLFLLIIVLCFLLEHYPLANCLLLIQVQVNNLICGTLIVFHLAACW